MKRKDQISHVARKYQITVLARKGYTVSEMAEILRVSPSCITFHARMAGIHIEKDMEKVTVYDSRRKIVAVDKGLTKWHF